MLIYFWSLSTIGSLEGQHFRKTGKLVSLSEQNLLDCAYGYGIESGCDGKIIARMHWFRHINLRKKEPSRLFNKVFFEYFLGGDEDIAFEFIKREGGIDTEESYPYEAVDPSMGSKCRFSKKNVGATDVGYTKIPSGDEQALKAAVATVGPISIAIDASNLQFYGGGMYL